METLDFCGHEFTTDNVTDNLIESFASFDTTPFDKENESVAVTQVVQRRTPVCALHLFVPFLLMKIFMNGL